MNIDRRFATVGARSLASLQQESLFGRDHEKTRQQPALCRAPTGERGAVRRQLRYVVGELRVQKVARIGTRHREQSVAI